MTARASREDLHAAALAGNQYATQEYIRRFHEAPTADHDPVVTPADIRKWTETQPRDDDGRFASGGGSEQDVRESIAHTLEQTGLTQGAAAEHYNDAAATVRNGASSTKLENVAAGMARFSTPYAQGRVAAFRTAAAQVRQIENPR